MELIDEKGRVLGVINIIDLTVLLFIISTVTGLWWLVQTGNLFKDFSEFNPRKEVFFDVKVEAVLIGQHPDNIHLLKKEIERLKDTEYLPLKILRITQIKPVVLKQPQVEIQIQRSDVTIQLNFRAKFDPLEKVYYYNGMPLALGTKLPLDTGFFKEDSIITNINR